MKISAVLFDMDGVIINTREEIELFWKEWAGKASISLTEKDIEEHIHGVPGARTLELLFSQVSEDFKKEIVEASLAVGKEVEKNVMAGFYEFIDYLMENGIRWGIVTSHTITSANRIIKTLNIDSKLSVLVTADQVERGKPFPDPYILGTKRIGFDPGQVLVFEDSISGCTAALAAGNKVIGVNTPKNADSLLKLGVEEVIESFDGVLNKMVKGVALKEQLIGKLQS